MFVSFVIVKVLVVKTFANTRSQLMGKTKQCEFVQQPLCCVGCSPPHTAYVTRSKTEKLSKMFSVITKEIQFATNEECQWTKSFVDCFSVLCECGFPPSSDCTQRKVVPLAPLHLL